MTAGVPAKICHSLVSVLAEGFARLISRPLMSQFAFSLIGGQVLVMRRVFHSPLPTLVCDFFVFPKRLRLESDRNIFGK